MQIQRCANRPGKSLIIQSYTRFSHKNVPKIFLPPWMFSYYAQQKRPKAYTDNITPQEFLSNALNLGGRHEWTNITSK